MPYYCVLCKKEPIPADKSRSFHKFPDDDGLRQKWMAFAGISSITKYTKLCSDHFATSAYEDFDGSKIKRSLRKSAVPCKFVSTDQAQSVNYSVTKDQTQLNLQKQSCVSNVSVNTVVNVLPSINNDLPANTSRAFGENKQDLCQPLSHRTSNSSVAVDLNTSKIFSTNSSVAVNLGTSSNLSKSHCDNISRNNFSTQVLQEQITQQTVFNNTQFNDNRTNLK
ncbi:uncharacterized protein LOC117182537, partial [Belonocnema kinseyi]|uniref:uncharacterized protein LOC117182537 n=1 Tax=Belonocnema kinseyi TaxID=2817044 RepID=UPI00143CD118